MNGESLFSPLPGDIFGIVTATEGITGQFSTVELPLLAMGRQWQVEYLTQEVLLSVVASPDFNRDGVVNAADYVVWRRDGGTLQELQLWRQNFGSVLGNGGSAQTLDLRAVPEPSSALLLCCAAVGVVCLCGNRRRM